MTPGEIRDNPRFHEFAAAAKLIGQNEVVTQPATIAWQHRVVQEAMRTDAPPRQIAQWHWRTRTPVQTVIEQLQAASFFGAEATFATNPGGFISGVLSWSDGMAKIVGAGREFVRPSWLPEKKARPKWRKPFCDIALNCFFEPSGTSLDLLCFFVALPMLRESTRAISVRRTVGLIEASSNRVGFAINDYSTPRQPFVRGNYTEEVLEQYDRLRAFCQRKTPPEAGALVLLDGPPGTGKTHLIRGLINNVAAPFVLAAGSTIANLENPGFVPFVLRECRDRGGLVLILEDADSVVIKRDLMQDVSTLSLLLNATSGILGDLMNLRVIATVNTWSEDRVDPAVLRPGRLFSRIHVGELAEEHAREVVLRVSKGNELAARRVTGELTLAQAYAVARGESP